MNNDNKRGGGINDPDFVFSGNPNAPSRKRKCPNCKQEFEGGGEFCPHCNHYLYEKRTTYQPIDRKTAKRIKIISGAILLVIFGALVLFGAIKLDACQSAEAFLPLKNLV